jgi:polysaccharide biosynthesis/export protein
MRITSSTPFLRFAVAVLLAAATPAISKSALSAQQNVPSNSVGEFNTGDRIVVRVDSEPQLSDTFTVVVGPALLMPIVGQVSLAGITHQNLERHLTRELGRFLRSPVVHARPLIRVGVLGEVGRPGYYVMPSDVSIAEAISIANGVTSSARTSEVRIQRNDSTVWPVDSVRAALVSGVSLFQFGVRSGDEIVVPRGSDIGGDAERIGRILVLLVSIPLTLIALKRGHP